MTNFSVKQSTDDNPLERADSCFQAEQNENPQKDT